MRYFPCHRAPAAPPIRSKQLHRLRVVGRLTVRARVPDCARAHHGGDSTRYLNPAPLKPTTLREQMTFALPKIDAEFDKWLAAQLQASPADPKDVDDFR
jgi:hypothetical protein